MTARLRALKASLRLLSTMQQNAGAADRLRLLIEGPLPQALAKLFEHWTWFSEHGYAVGMDPLGPAMFCAFVVTDGCALLLWRAIGAAALNVFASMIHMEPTSLTALQEAGLHTALLSGALAQLPMEDVVRVWHHSSIFAATRHAPHANRQ